MTKIIQIWDQGELLAETLADDHEVEEAIKELNALVTPGDFIDINVVTPMTRQQMIDTIGGDIDV